MLKITTKQNATKVSKIAALLICGILFSLPAMAQDSKAKAPTGKQKETPPELKPIEEIPGLPRVLLIGDSISLGYTIPVRELLQGKANVVRPLTNCGPSSRGVESIEKWLGDGKWDVIHFNFGLHDMVFFSADGTKRSEPKADGARHQVSVEDYEKNLSTLVTRMKETGATLIWCTTTPVPEGAVGRLSDEAVLYNSIAAKVMEKHSVAVDDLHAFALPRLTEIQRPKDVHFSKDGSKALAGEVVKSIETALSTRAK